MSYCIGIDIGGTKIIVALIAQDGQIAERVTFPTPPVATLLTQTIEACRAFITKADVGAVGVGAAGQIDTGRGVVAYAGENIPHWTGTPIASTLKDALGLPVIADNDVNALAFAEAMQGAGRDTASGVYVAVGTGIGGAIVQNGQLWRGSHWSAGEFGHMMMAWENGRACACGGKGHLEAYAAGTSMAKEYCHRAGIPIALNLRPVVELAQHGNPLAQAVLIEGGRVLGIALNGLANAIDPEIIVVGGGVADIGGVWWQAVETALREGNLLAPQQVRLERAQLGADAVVIGAGLLAWGLI